MKIKIVEFEGGSVFDLLCEYETPNPEIFTDGYKISLSNNEVYYVNRSWFNIAEETLYVHVKKLGSAFDWLNGFV